MQSSGTHCAGEERPDDRWEASGCAFPVPVGRGAGRKTKEHPREGVGRRGRRERPPNLPCLGESCKIHQCERPLVMVVALGTG